MSRVSIVGPSLPAAWPAVFECLARFRCASLEQLRLLAPTHINSRSSLRRTVACMQSAGWLARARLPGTPRVAYLLTRKTLRKVPTLRERCTDAWTSAHPDLLVYGWQRAEAWRRLALEGWRVGRDRLALATLRDYLLHHAASERLVARLQNDPSLHDPRTPDGQPLVAVYRCHRCGRVSHAPHSPHAAAGESRTHTCYARMRRSDVVTFDIAYRKGAPNEPPLLLVVDEPFRSVLAQLMALPLRNHGYNQRTRVNDYQARLDVMFLPSDDGSLWDDEARRWARIGPRLCLARRVLGTLVPTGTVTFPFARTARLVDPLPALYLAQLRRSLSSPTRSHPRATT